MIVKLKMPPNIKVLEAAGAIADQRVKIWQCNENTISASVVSSTGDRKYTVVIKKALVGFRVYSNDNGTLFRRYIGYPIISVLMLSGLLPRNPRIENALKGIPWKRLNETYKRYTLVENIILNKIKNQVNVRDVMEFKNKVINALKEIDIVFDSELASKACRG